jgi:hypothetical protein
MVSNTYLPPQNTYLPAENSHLSSLETPSPIKPQFAPYTSPSNVYEPPKEPCSSQCCDDNSKGKLVIPIPLKNRKPDECCSKVAQLILPLKNIDITIVAQLRENLSRKEFDVDQLIRSILENLL